MSLSQSPIGTNKTLQLMGRLPEGAVLFQSPIGTNKTGSKDLIAEVSSMFQSPIGTNKTV